MSTGKKHGAAGFALFLTGKGCIETERGYASVYKPASAQEWARHHGIEDLVQAQLEITFMTPYSLTQWGLKMTLMARGKVLLSLTDLDRINAEFATGGEPR